MFYKIIKSIVSVMFRMIYRINIVNEDELINNKKLIICSNHVHIFDPIILTIIFPNQIHWMGKKELFENKLLNYIFLNLGAFPVDRNGVGLSTIRTSTKILNNDSTLGIFPEGTRVKELDLNNAKPGIALISIKTQTPILPIYIETSYKPFSKINIYIGEKLEFTESYNKRLSSEDYKLKGEKVLKEIYNIKDNMEVI